MKPKLKWLFHQLSWPILSLFFGLHDGPGGRNARKKRGLQSEDYLKRQHMLDISVPSQSSSGGARVIGASSELERNRGGEARDKKDTILLWLFLLPWWGEGCGDTDTVVLGADR
ncbi:hypothetical protein LSTR_LSTR016795 [Laodelphax striatellus]|uniref:Uncharacterized protein n=1 Tax=Laodelphax striatellus TaxID=195883 RepID=A0A482WXF2_LAOST|nr:hypothetical protein LSTR_LSTR016795 [Laodelphax striatellus]